MIRIRHAIGRGKIKKEMVFSYRVKAVFEKYYNKWWPSVTQKREWKKSVPKGTYKVLVQMVEEQMGSYKEVCCIDGPDPRWKMGLVYGVVDASLIEEVGPLLGNSLL